MSKRIRGLPVLVSIGLAAVAALGGYLLVNRMPGNQWGLGIEKSPFQADPSRSQSSQGAHAAPIPAAELARWSGYTGKLGNDVLYYIFVDRFFDGDPANNRPRVNAPIHPSVQPGQSAQASQAVQVDQTAQATRLEQQLSDASSDPNHRLFGLYFGGDLEGVRQKLPYLAQLGVTKIVLSPIQEGAPGFLKFKGANFYLDNGDGSLDRSGRAGLMAGYHGYWIRDWFRLDPHMRSTPQPDDLASLNRLLDAAQRHGIGIILDLTLHHSSPVAPRASLTGDPPSLNVFPALGEVREHGVVLANLNTQPGWYERACEMDYARATSQMLTTCPIAYGLPTLNLLNPEVRDYLLRAVAFWLKVNPGGAQVAGIRLDAIKHIDPDFMRQVVEQVRRINPRAVVFAEDFGGGSQTATTADILDSVGDISTIDFSFTNSIRHFFSGDRAWTGNRTNVEASSLGTVLTSDLSSLTPNWFANPAGVLTGVQDSTVLFPANYPASKSWITSLETHDAPRLRTFRHLMTDAQYAAMIAFHFVARGVPMINYGAEIGLSVPPLPRNSGLNGLGGDPFNRQMMVWPGQPGFNRFLFDTTRTYVRLRKRNPVLRYGDTLFLRPIPDRWIGRPLLMLRADPSPAAQRRGTRAFLFAFSPEGGRYVFELPRGFNQPRSICDVQTGACLASDAGQQYSVLLRPDVHRVLEITF